MAMHTLEEFFVDRLKDIYDAEKRIVRALPKLVKAATSPELASAFEAHLRQTEGHVERLEEIFESLGRQPGRKACHGIMGILEEGEEMLQKEAAGSVRDAGLIAAAQDVEHYEMCSYGCLRTWAELLGHEEEARILQETLNEEGEADKKLTALAQTINRDALEESGENGHAKEHAMVRARKSSTSSSRPMRPR